MFFDEKKEHQLSDIGRFFIGGIFKHIKAITAIANPTINSYKRLGEFEAPKYIYYGRKNRDALIRLPEVLNSSSSRIEIRSPDPSANPYLLFSVLLEAGIEGIEKKMEPGEAIENDIYETKDYEKLEKLPSNLKEALEFLKRDELIRKCLKGAFEKFVKLKEEEWREFTERKITDWEMEKYFEI